MEVCPACSLFCISRTCEGTRTSVTHTAEGTVRAFEQTSATNTTLFFHKKSQWWSKNLLISKHISQLFYVFCHNPKLIAYAVITRSENHHQKTWAGQASDFHCDTLQCRFVLQMQPLFHFVVRNVVPFSCFLRIVTALKSSCCINTPGFFFSYC